MLLNNLVKSIMSINLKPHSLECGSRFTVLSFGSSKKQGALQTPTFKWGCPIVFLIINIRARLLENMNGLFLKS